jgi:hypothetical protein
MRKSGRWKMQKKFNRPICSDNLTTFKSHPLLRKPMSSAFDLAWSILKALPEQQAFFQSIYPPKRLGQPVDIYQDRYGTVPPPIMGAMRRMQSTDGKGGGEDNLNMGILGPFEEPRIMGQLTHAPAPPRRLASGGGDLASVFNSRMRRRTRSHPERKPVNRIDQSIAGPHEPLDADAIYAYLQSMGF